MKSYRLPAVLTLGAAVAFAWGCSDSGGDPNTAATAGGATLSAERLGTLIGNSQGPIETDFARTVAELWVNFQLAGNAAAKNDSITSKADMDYGLWSFIEGTKTKKFGEVLVKTLKPEAVAGCDDECQYNKGDVALAARHILISASNGTQPQAGPAVTPEQDAIAKKKAEAIRAEATPANFNTLTAKTEEPGGKERKGELPVFGPVGEMVEEFTKGVLETKPGEVSKVVKTGFGYHIIYRPTFAEVKDKVVPRIAQRPLAVAESVYFAKLDSVAAYKIDKNAPITVRAVARNTLGNANNNEVLATWNGGKLTAGRMADILDAYPPNMQFKSQLLSPQVNDTMLNNFVKVQARNQIIIKQADSAKIALDTAEMANFYMGFRNNLTTAWTQIGVDPKLLADSAKSDGDRLKLANTRVDTYFDKLVKGEVGFADLAYPVTRTLHKKYPFKVNEAGLAKAIEKAKAVRGSADSLKAKQGPPTPGAAEPAPGAPPAGAPPAGAPPAGTTPPGKP